MRPLIRAPNGEAFFKRLSGNPPARIVVGGPQDLSVVSVPHYPLAIGGVTSKPSPNISALLPDEASPHEPAVPKKRRKLMKFGSDPTGNPPAQDGSQDAARDPYT